MSLLKVSEITDLTGNGSVYAPGHVVQVVNSSTTSSVATTSATWQDGLVSASITPKFATSKILILISQTVNNNTSAKATWVTVFRGTTSGTNLGDVSDGIIIAYTANAGDMAMPGSMSALDSPASTSPITYTTAFRANGGTGTLGNGKQLRTITLMEIAQ